MRFHEIEAIVAQIDYKPGWFIMLDHDRMEDGGRPFIQIAVTGIAEASLCPFTGERVPWKGGKKYLSYHMCRQEIVGAVLGAIKDAEMHELHEWFKYKGRAIYSPHLDPDALAELARYKRNFNFRENAMTMEEKAPSDA